MGSDIPIETVGCNEKGVTAVQCQPAYLDPSEGSASDTAGQSASVVNMVSSYLYNFMKKTIKSVYPAVAYAYTVGSPVLNNKRGYSGTVGSII